MLWPGCNEANLGFSSSSTVPICTIGPKRPMRALISLPLAGSTPSTRALPASVRSSDSLLVLTSSLNGPQKRSINGTHSSSPRDTASSSSSSLAVKS